MTTSLAPRLLLSMPQLMDPNFARTVVLLCDHEPEGAFGLVLNRSATKAISGSSVTAVSLTDNMLQKGGNSPFAHYSFARWACVQPQGPYMTVLAMIVF